MLRIVGSTEILPLTGARRVSQRYLFEWRVTYIGISKPIIAHLIAHSNLDSGRPGVFQVEVRECIPLFFQNKIRAIPAPT